VSWLASLFKPVPFLDAVMAGTVGDVQKHAKAGVERERGGSGEDRNLKAPKGFTTIATLGLFLLSTSCAAPNISDKTYADEVGDTITFYRGTASVETRSYARMYSYRQFRDKGANQVFLSDFVFNPSPLAQNFAAEVSDDGLSLTVSSGSLGFKEGEYIRFKAQR
jgi:hypothetical protein